MVSKASDDFPEPESPVITIKRLRGKVRSMFLRLCSRAPLMTIASRPRGAPLALEEVTLGRPGGAAGRCSRRGSGDAARTGRDEILADNDERRVGGGGAGEERLGN